MRRSLLYTCLLLALTACEFGKTTIGLGVPTIVVHAVLNPTASVEEILVERALTGATFVDTSASYDPTQPISSGGGLPISGATVIIYGPTGDSVIASEGFPDGGGSGVYLIANTQGSGIASTPPAGMPAFAFTAGHQYRLRVVTTDGAMVTGTTTIPGAPASFDSTTQPQPFDRTQDTLTLQWPAVQAARNYLVQVSTPFNTFETLIDTTITRIPGDARNAEAQTIPHLFIPGFTQIAIVGAVDSNYYDYERFRTDVSTTSTRINHLVGGLGVFGAYVPLVFRQIAVTAPSLLPIEGSYTNSTIISNAPSHLQLYVESPATGNGLAQLSGNYLQADGTTGGLIGVFDDTHLTLDILQGQTTIDTLLIIDGTLHPDSITAMVRGSTDPLIYTKTPPPG